MGSGIVLMCACKEHHINEGIGMRYPTNFKEKMQEARDGKLGVDMQKATEGKQYLAIDAAIEFVYCDSCGYWVCESNNDLYEPKDLEKIKKESFGEKTVEEWGEIPYVWEFDDYNLIYHYQHMCPHCNKEMRHPKRIDKRVLNKIKCPDCGGKLEESDDSMIMWD
ncbi:MAG: hypothetical protein HUJ56_07625 [Erysipelotrichaceae bacterium]|nr:hypothetical protein [Erysipelotrichaceae bacterium]